MYRALTRDIEVVVEAVSVDLVDETQLDQIADARAQRLSGRRIGEIRIGRSGGRWRIERSAIRLDPR